jgi:CBS domain-containing protein
MPARVQDVMTIEVVVGQPATPVRQVARLLADHRLSVLPVVDGQGRVLGVVSEAFCSAMAGRSRTGSRRPRLVR